VNYLDEFSWNYYIGLACASLFVFFVWYFLNKFIDYMRKK